MNIATVNELLEDLAYEMRTHYRSEIGKTLCGWVTAYDGTIGGVNGLVNEITGRKARLRMYEGREIGLLEVASAEWLVRLLQAAVAENDQQGMTRLVKRLQALFIKA